MAVKSSENRASNRSRSSGLCMKQGMPESVEEGTKLDEVGLVGIN